jgi:signal transduction histidine kinase
VQARPEEGNVIVTIKDSGSGVPEGIDIFEPFSTTKENGTGLGLAIVRQIVLAHRGTISYESTTGVGTTFTFTLPVAPHEERQQIGA